MQNPLKFIELTINYNSLQTTSVDQAPKRVVNIILYHSHNEGLIFKILARLCNMPVAVFHF